MRLTMLRRMPVSSAVDHPLILQYPCQSLLRPTQCGAHSEPTSETNRNLLEKLTSVRAYYEYPGLSAVQIGWNFPAFAISIPATSGTYTLKCAQAAAALAKKSKTADTTMTKHALTQKQADLQGVHLCMQPECLWKSEQQCWAWEACASCCFLMHYIERPREVIGRWIDVDGQTVVAKLSGMGSRLYQHEMDHMGGKAFYERIPNISHAVPLAGFRSMSMWKSDFPSIEARSTYLYTTYTPPFTFHTAVPEKSAFMDRTFDDEVYPGIQFDEAMCEQFAERFSTKN